MSHTTVPRHLPWLIWVVGAGVYFFGLIHRTSLGVIGPEASVRLDLNATQLSAFLFVQLGLYALIQIPAGQAIDHWGPRRVLLVATLAMGSAQMMFAFATSFSTALVARALLGVGDAPVFIAVLRLAAAYFPKRRYAFMTMLTALVGMGGNMLATVPLVLALNRWGWGTTFLFSGACSVAYALLLLRPAVAASASVPAGYKPAKPPKARQVWAQSEVRLGFWTHLATLHPGVVLTLLWGFAYLTQGLGYSDQTAASILSFYIATNVASSFVIGPLAGRKPGWRTAMALGVTGAITLTLIGLVTWPGGHPPLWYVSLTFATASVGVPASQIGFHLARDYSPARSISTATGLINAGGFVGAIIASLTIGATIDTLGGPSLSNYRWALSFFAGFSTLSTLITLLSTLKVRNLVFQRMAEGQTVVVPLHIRFWDRAYSRVLNRPLPTQ